MLAHIQALCEHVSPSIEIYCSKHIAQCWPYFISDLFLLIDKLPWIQVRTGAAQVEGGIHGLVSYEKKAFWLLRQIEWGYIDHGLGRGWLKQTSFPDSIMVFSGARRSSSETLNPCVYNFRWFCFACMCKAPSRPPLSLALCGFISQTKFSIPNCVWNKLRWIYWWMLISASPCFVPRHINSWPCCSCELLCFRVSVARH
jgi:hypothetical protein